MSELGLLLEFFHFLRPGWLALIPLALLLWWRLRRQASGGPAVPEAIAPHLAEALTVARRRRGRLFAIDGIALTALIFALAAAGPTWTRVANPLAAQTAPLAIVMLTAESMLDTDVQPARMARAQQKVLDLVEGRAGALTALIAYAGTAHRVVPLTEDPEVLKPFVDALLPEIMPEPGRDATAALRLAAGLLAEEPVPGAILFVLDGLDPADRAAFAQHADGGGARVVFLAVSGDPSVVSELDRVPGATALAVTPDDSDVRAIERRVDAAYREALARDDRQQWDDRGWLLAWPAALLSLLWFRRGWTMQWCLLALVAGAGFAPGSARADGWVDWFLTADQQARLKFDARDYLAAAETFDDPAWRGYALYEAGKYVEAAAVFARLPGAAAAFAEGVAWVKGREYRKGITAFETALQRDPEHPGATTNLELARAILAYVEQAREAGDTGEGSEGADEVRFDKEAEGGVEQAMTAATEKKVLSAEQWMRTVDTRTADFLEIRFQLEAGRSGQ